MKVTVKQQPEEFKPVTLEITLESREELEAMYQVGNYSYQIQELINKEESKFGKPSNHEIDEALIIFFNSLRPLL
jgi:hypothetical protein